MQADPIYQAKWLEIVKNYKTSNQTMKTFSKRNNIKVSQLHYWLKKYKMRAIDKRTQFIEIKTDKQVINQNSIKLSYGKLTIELSDNFNESSLLKILKVADQVV
ncbi:MAG: hypothetical protein WC152_07065 [Candidatus Izemoplasmatales bacterium]